MYNLVPLENCSIEGEPIFDDIRVIVKGSLRVETAAKSGYQVISFDKSCRPVFSYPLLTGGEIGY
jgi:hypothetical protein